MPPHVFAIDGRQLSYARFAQATRALELLEYRSVELSPELFNEGPLGGLVTEPAALAAAAGEVLEGASSSVEAGSLILPEGWLRVVFAETGDLPRSAKARDEVLRWQLRRLVPYRVEDLRLNAIAVRPLREGGSGRRLLLGFAMEHLLSHLEEAFAENGVRIGQVSNQSLALLSGLQGALQGLELGAFVHVQDDAYTLVATRHGEPVVHRFKAVNGTLPAEAQEGLVRRDLRLTRVFLADQVDTELQRMILVCPRSQEGGWRGWLEEIFEIGVGTLSEAWEVGAGATDGVEAAELGPMFGAARREAR